MTAQQVRNALVYGTAALALSACGGSGGTGINAISAPPVTPTPTPTPTPAPAPATALNIFASAPTGELAVSAINYSGVYLDLHPMASLTVAQANQPRFRYDSAKNIYEVMMPGGAWDTLATTDQTLPDWGRRLRSGTTGNDSFFLSFERSLGQEDAYPNSTLGRYFNGGRWGWIAVGIPTPVASLPTSGSASYSGIVRGAADVMVDDGWGGLEPTDVTGSVTLTFDFGHSSLAGSMSASLANFGTVGVLGSLGTVNFANTVYSAGHYSGTFATSVAGVNSFSGTLTGPGAQELIGAWAMPFHYSVDGQDHQAAGAWVAKKP